MVTAVRPRRNLRQILVHPKDKVEDKHKTDCVYQIPCKNVICVSLVKQEEHLVPDLKNKKKEWKQ